jgi:hypothetical protein
VVPVYIRKVHGTRRKVHGTKSTAEGTRYTAQGARAEVKGLFLFSCFLVPCAVHRAPYSMRRAPCTILQKLMRVEFSEIPI